MIAAILRDSLILFLLIYAVLDLGHRIILFVLNTLCKTRHDQTVFYVIDVSKTPPQALEYTLRSALLQAGTPIVVPRDALGDEAIAIINALSRKHAALRLCSSGELASLFTGEATQNASLHNAKTASPSHNK